MTSWTDGRLATMQRVILLCSTLILISAQISRAHTSGWPMTHLSSWPTRDHLAKYETGVRKLSPNLGSVRVLVVLIRFPEHASRTLPSADEIKTLCEGQVATFFEQQSYGKLTLSGCDVQDWVSADNTEAYYSYNQYGRVGYTDIQKIFFPALNQMDANAAGQMDFWSQYDSDQDGLIDLVVAIHSGYGAEFGGADCTNNREPMYRIQSQAWNGYMDGGWLSSTDTLSYGIQGFVILAGLEGACDSNPVKVGKFAHECTHTLTGHPPDLYDLTLGSRGVGGFDIMSSAYGPSGQNGDAPGSMSPWTKALINWTTPTEITTNGDYTMRPASSFADYYAIRNGFPDQEYLLLEYRVPTGFDSDFYGSGMVLWHIDDTQDGNAKSGFPAQGNWPQNGNIYKVAVVQADGLFEIEQNINIGDVGDIFTPGMSIGPGSGTYPNTNSYQGGAVTQTGITITVVSMDNSSLTFRVEGMDQSAPVATPVAAPVSMPLTVPTSMVPVAYPSVPTSTAPVAVPTVVTPATSAMPTTAGPISTAPTSLVPLSMVPTSLAPAATPAAEPLTTEAPSALGSSPVNGTIAPAVPTSRLPTKTPSQKSSRSPTASQPLKASTSASPKMGLQPVIVVLAFLIASFMI